MNISETET